MAKPDRANILVIWGDDIGIWNISCYSRGMMGYRTPGKPFFCWVNTTHMHCRTHPRPESLGQAGGT